jgi:hypothetical protein
MNGNSSVANNGKTNYTEPVKETNGNVKRTRTRRLVRKSFRNANTGSLFTREDLVNLINKSILFFYKMKKDANVENYNTKRRQLFNLEPIYKRLIVQLPVLSFGVQRGERVPIIKFMYNKVYECNSMEKCIDTIEIDRMEIKCAIVKGVDVAFILHEGNRMSALVKEPTFINSLSEKEQAFAKLIFDNANVLTDDSFRLTGFIGEDIGEQLNLITNKNRTSRLRFSNKVHVKEIPNRKTMRNIIRYWNK